MKIKFTLTRSGHNPVDLVTTVDSTATVGDLAEHLIAADPLLNGRPPGGAAGVPRTLAVAGRAQLDPSLKVGESGLRSGSTVAIVPTGSPSAITGSGPAVVVRVTAGPDRGAEFELYRGGAVIGRDRDCAIRLTDPLVSRRHATVYVTDVVEIADLGSANGVQLGDAVVSRSPLRSGDRIRVGDTELVIRVVQNTRSDVDGVEFVRGPRLDPRYVGVELVAPEPPQRTPPSRFPFIAIIAPLLMGAVLYLVTKSMLSLVFIALSPLMVIGYSLETTLASRSAFRKAVAQFRADVTDLTAEATAANAAEATARNREHPGLTECVDAVRTGGSLLWSRRPADPGFCEFRLGTGRRPARNRIELPDGRRLPRDLMAELTAATEPFGWVDAVPVVATPTEHGAIGIAGPRPVLLDSARALLAQAAIQHSPAELAIVGLASAPTARDWDWLKWLPHTTATHRDLPKRTLAAGAADATGLVAELEELLAARVDTKTALPAVLVLVEDDTPVERSRLVELAERGWQHGIHLVWLAAAVNRLPAACRTFVAVDTVGYVHDGAEVTPVTVESLDERTATEVARRLAPLVDSGARVDDDSDLPRVVSLMSVPEQKLTATASAVLESWQANRSIVSGPHAPAEKVRQQGTLRAVIGTSASGVYALDLRAQGPHALIGGTTGSGKSELLQAWILAMALAHSPQRLTFLLVDYKGGAAFEEFATLPHNVGLVTDLSPHLVRRALVSLDAELKRRERLFRDHSVKDLEELERLDSAIAPPSLVIVVDEFAALVKELPEFVDGVVNVAQRGRSLGVHLILATQRPAGVIRENLRANTNLRIALRTADEADSLDVLGSPQAALFDQDVPGRAVAKTGPGRLVTFQAGYVGGWTPTQTPPPEIVVEELRFGTGAFWTAQSEVDASADRGPTDITRLVAAIGSAHTAAAIAPPRRPWLPDLKKVYDLSNRADVTWTRRDDELVFGVGDDPVNQSQPTVAFRPDQDGNLCVYGTGGSGKTTLLRTLAISAGYNIHGGPCHVYGLDFGSKGLAMLADLPHVGAIIDSADHERVVRLFTWLREVIDTRAARYAKAAAGTVTEYRALTGQRAEPRILLLLDGVGAFRKAYETPDRMRWFEAFTAIANDGRPVGVHVLLSADRPSTMSSALASAVQTRVTLRMADPADYSLVGVPSDVLGPGSPPGRGILRGTEIQVAVLSADPSVRAQAADVTAFAAAMREAGAVSAPEVRRLGDLVPLGSLPAVEDGKPVLGLVSDTLGPLTFSPTGTFVVAGPPGAGRTTAVHTVALALRRWNPQVRLHYFGGRRSPLAGLDLWDESACGVEDIADLAKRLAADLGDGPAALVIENVPALANTPADIPLTQLVKLWLDEDRFVLADGEASAMQSSMGVLAAVKEDRTGIALSPDTNDGPVFRTVFPNRLNRAEFPPGRGLYVHTGRTTLVQVALGE